MQTWSWGVRGTDFKWTNCIFILSAAVFGETAVLRCLIIPHLWGDSIAPWEPNHIGNFWCQTVFLKKMDGLAFPQNAAFMGGVFHLTCWEQCLFQEARRPQWMGRSEPPLFRVIILKSSLLAMPSWQLDGKMHLSINSVSLFLGGWVADWLKKQKPAELHFISVHLHYLCRQKLRARGCNHNYY